MRRKDKQIVDNQLIEKILNVAEVIRLSMVDNDEPYLVAMNYAYDNGCLYMHSAKEGRKIDILKKNNKIAFQTDIGIDLIINDDACNCCSKYMSVFGTGLAFLIEEDKGKGKST